MESVFAVLADTDDVTRILLELTQQSSFLFVLVIFFGFIDKKFIGKLEVYRNLCFGIGLGTIAILCMSTPILMSPGYLLDARSVVIAITTLFGGPLSGAIVAFFTSIYRLALGGDGALFGTLAIWISFGFAWAFQHLSHSGRIKLSGQNLLILGAAIHGMIFLLLFSLPLQIWMKVFVQIGLPMFFLFSPVLALVGVILRDMQARRLMSEQLLAQDKELLSTMDRLKEHQRILDEHAIVAETDQAGRITYVNDKFCEISKYDREELIGQNHRILKSDHHSDEFFKVFWETITSGKVWQGEVCNKAKDGSLYWVSSTVMPLYRGSNSTMITGYISVRTDITESKRTEEALRHSQKMEAVGELTGGIAHDFNNLLGIIVGNHDLMMRHLEEGTKARRLLDKAQKAALRGASLTRRLLGFSRRAAHEVKTVELNQLIVDLNELVSRSLTSKVKMETKLAPALWHVDVDTSDFEDAIINLSVNARDAMPEGGEIIVSTRNITFDKTYLSHKSRIEPGEYVEIVVSDNGQGMPSQLREKVFEPFFTTKEQGKGTGLGLSMVYGFVQRSNGYISVYSELGMGTAFKIYLPRSSKDISEKVEEENSTYNATDGNETILVVDDEDELVEVAKDVLEGHGYNVLTASTGDEAIAYLNINPDIQVIFTDVVMPGKTSGFELAEYAKSVNTNISVLLASGFTKDMKDTEIGKKWSPYLITKPYRTEDMVHRIRMLIDKKKMEK
ncbi:PAS domain S-box protein [Curvivirga sp.]|uniref:PAS domain S-box protein n=1 Tax=Curvivirga sp. TaxID=2856848 RepID=UPI003B5B4F22